MSAKPPLSKTPLPESPHVATQRADYRKRANFNLRRRRNRREGESEFIGTLTLPDGGVWILEANTATDPDGSRYFEGTPFHHLLRTAKVSGDPKAIPDDLIARMEAPFDDPIPPETGTPNPSPKNPSPQESVA